MATVADLVNSIKDNLGNRNTGNIGTRPVDTVVLDNINRTILNMAKAKKHIAAFERKISIAVNSSNYVYNIPTVDVNNQTIRIKKVIKMVSVRGTETTGYPIDRISTLRRDTLFPLTNTTRVGRPVLYSAYGTQFEFYPYPDTDYTVTGRVVIWPSPLLITDASTGFGPEFDEVFEAGATTACFQTLQQIEDANYWAGLYKDLLAQMLASLDDYPDESLFNYSSDTLIGDMVSLGPVMLSGRTEAYNSALGVV